MSSPSNSIDPNTVVLPIIVFIYDCDIRRVYRKREIYWVLFFKTLAWVLYYLVLGLVYRSSQTGVNGVASQQTLINLLNFIFLIYPVAATIYSICLTKFDLFSMPVVFRGQPGEVDSDEQLRRFENILNERANLIDMRQQ